MLRPFPPELLEFCVQGRRLGAAGRGLREQPLFLGDAAGHFTQLGVADLAQKTGVGFVGESRQIAVILEGVVVVLTVEKQVGELAGGFAVGFARLVRLVNRARQIFGGLCGHHDLVVGSRGLALLDEPGKRRAFQPPLFHRTPGRHLFCPVASLEITRGLAENIFEDPEGLVELFDAQEIVAQLMARFGVFCVERHGLQRELGDRLVGTHMLARGLDFAVGGDFCRAVGGLGGFGFELREIGPLRGGACLGGIEKISVGLDSSRIAVEGFLGFSHGPLPIASFDEASRLAFSEAKAASGNPEES